MPLTQRLMRKHAWWEGTAHQLMRLFASHELGICNGNCPLHNNRRDGAPPLATPGESVAEGIVDLTMHLLNRSSGGPQPLQLPCTHRPHEPPWHSCSAKQ
eukprot:TRINITY_DN3353_c0_g1_i4.p2 TRINITY_DN3353_c0_g1~~TRINITY_DN3353_c0_g1_i4.p2  ORF type:complete len:100 (-),score=4.92 TRINITY_DN3353_c0_g1_i4:718-1017(-)